MFAKIFKTFPKTIYVISMFALCLIIINLIYNKKSLTQFDANLTQKLQESIIPTTTTVKPSRKDILKTILSCRDRALVRETLQYGEYWLIRNLIIGEYSRNVGCAETITYTANSDYTFMADLIPVVKRWLAPISFALYSPGYDTIQTLNSIAYLRNCLPESDLIRRYVSFHIYFPAKHMPKSVPLNEIDAGNWTANCDVIEPPYVNVNRSFMYKTLKNLTFPINVGRNIARKAVNTYFIFACDIELMPSIGLVDMFLNMVLHNQSAVLSDDPTDLRVFPIPVFELEENATIPTTKTELLKMLYKKMAIPFHAKICKKCHLVPGQDIWMNTTSIDTLSIVSMGYRENDFKYWEPFYISDNREPMFDERVTWEGQSNKRIQNFAMCLLHYQYHILHPAFLVHSPGIKRFQKNSSRLQYVAPMNKLIKRVIEPEYRILYGNSKKCKT